MLKGREILSLPVITENNKKQIGEIKDIIYDPSQNKIIGYLLDTGSWLRDGRGFLHENLLKIENECMVIENELVVKSIDEIPELKEAIDQKKDIRGLRVEMTNGKNIGVIQDIVIADNSPIITGYEVSDGVIQDLLEGRITIPNSGVEIKEDNIVTISEVDLKTKGDLS